MSDFAKICDRVSLPDPLRELAKTFYCAGLQHAAGIAYDQRALPEFENATAIVVHNNACTKVSQRIQSVQDKLL